jgi:hypothetical protein
VPIFPQRENTMSKPAHKKDDDATLATAQVAQEQDKDVGHEDDRMEDEEKILAGRHDVNYPALLTKDVPGG